MARRTPYGRRLFACVLALLLVAGLVPALPEAPRALAEEAGAIALGDDGAEIRAVEDEAIDLGGDATAEGADELGDADSLVVGEQGEAVALDEAAEDALHDQLEPAAQQELAADGEAAPKGEPALEVQSSGVSVSNPRVVKDSSMESGQITTWDCVWFGSYPQTEVAPGDAAYASLQSAVWDANGDSTVGGTRYRRISKRDTTLNRWSLDGYGSTTYRYFRYEPIKWRVLEVNGTNALVMADIGLDDQWYDADQYKPKWETSVVRSWLNGYGASANHLGKDFSHRNFANTAFTPADRSAIIEADNTKDKVFLLSGAEVRDSSHGFVTSERTYDEARRCIASDYARAMGSYDYPNGNCIWKLRDKYAVLSTGYIEPHVGDADRYEISEPGEGGEFDVVRPALNISLTSLRFQVAGTVSSNGDVRESEKKTISSVSLSQTTHVYDGSAKKPTVTVRAGKETVPADGYSVSYRRNVRAGIATVTVTGKGRYTGINSVSFTISRKDISTCMVTLSSSSYIYDGTQKTPSIAVKDGSKTLSYGDDYRVTTTPSGRTNVGTYTYTVTGLDNYTGTKSATFTINPKSLSSCTVALSPSSYTYDGKAKTPAVTVRDGSKTLAKDSDYTVKYEDNVNVGTAKATVTGKGNYTGTKSATFTIERDKTYKVGRDTWNFQNFDVGPNGIPIEYCQRLFGYSYGKTVFGYDVGNGGECYGMAAAAQSSVVYGRPPVTSYKGNGLSGSKLFDVGINWKNSNNGLTARQLILYGQIAQKDPKMLKELSANAVFKSNIKNLTKLKDAVQNSTTPITLLIFPGTGGGHAVWALGVTSDTSSATTIRIYDSNWPNEEREVKLMKNASGTYNGWSFQFWWNETWGTSQNSNAFISWSTPGDDLQLLIDRNGKFDKDAYERELWYDRLYHVPNGVGVVADGKTYTITEGMSRDTDSLLVAPNIGMTPAGNVERDDVLCWSNLPAEVGFVDIDKPSKISVSSSSGGVSASVAAGSEMVVNVSNDDDDSVDIMQPKGSSFEVEYFGDDAGDVVISGRGDQVVSTTKAGDNLVVSGVTRLTVESDAGSETIASLDSSSSYTVMPEDVDGEAKIVLGDLKDALVKCVETYTYNGKAQKPNPAVIYHSERLVAGKDYEVSYKGNVNAGSGVISVTGIGNYGGRKKVKFTIAKAANPMRLKAVARTAKYATVRKKAVTVAAPLKLTKKAQGTVTYAKVAKGSSKVLSVNKKTGKVTVKRETKKGSYKVRIKATAKGNANYKALSKTITCKVVVK